MAYDNKNSGMLARNERKQQPNHPDYTGTLDVDGKQFWLSAWIKEGGPQSKMAGKKFFSIAVKPKDAAPATAQPAATSAVADDMEAPASAPAAATKTTTVMNGGAKPPMDVDEPAF